MYIHVHMYTYCIWLLGCRIRSSARRSSNNNDDNNNNGDNKHTNIIAINRSIRNNIIAIIISILIYISCMTL